MNPLLKPYTTPFETIPFDQIKTEHFLPALEQAIEEAKKQINYIANHNQIPTFENTIVTLDFATEKVDHISELFFNLNSAETNQEMQQLAKTISPLLAEFSNDIILNENLFSKINRIYEQANSFDFSREEWMLLEKTFKSFARNGANLTPEEKEELREIDKKKATLSLEFSEHLLEENNKYQLIIEKEEDLEGLPQNAIEMAQLTAEEKGLSGKWVITLDYPSYIPFMTYAKNRNLRKELFYAFSSKANKGDNLDNKSIIKELVKLRERRANLLGYPTHSHFVLEERMAENPKKVIEFLNELYNYAKPAALSEMEELKEFALTEDNLHSLQRWDYAYYSEKLKLKKYAVDNEMLRPYFKLEDVVEGVFIIAKKLFGLNYIERTDISVYHPDVKVYEVQNNTGEFIGIYYADYFPREGKRSGAWMTSFKTQYRKNGINVRPHVSIVCNFTKPTANTPSLLSFDEVTTLFHEFGHSLHGILANSHFPSLSGTNVYWDFVELPSQIMENWTYEKQSLDLFAKHHQTGETIPEELIQKIKDSSNHHSGIACLRQLSFGFLDMAWHSTRLSDQIDVDKFEKEAIDKTNIFPPIKGINSSCSFAHIFSGGYSSGYYSYKWAEVLDADAFEYFKKKGIFNEEVAHSFLKNILSAGGSEHPSILYKRFRGKEPRIKALLKRSNLVK